MSSQYENRQAPFLLKEQFNNCYSVVRQIAYLRNMQKKVEPKSLGNKMLLERIAILSEMANASFTSRMYETCWIMLRNKHSLDKYGDGRWIENHAWGRTGVEFQVLMDFAYRITSRQFEQDFPF